MNLKRTGFTLIEVLVALTILVGAIVVINAAWSNNFARYRKANFYNNVALLLERKMTEIEVEYKDVSIEQIPEEVTGDFGADYPQYRWEFHSKELLFPDLSSILSTGEEAPDETLVIMLKQLAEYISQSVKEGTVTIFVKTPQKELSYSLTTYFIDYNKDLPIGPGAGAPVSAGGG